MKDNQAKYFIVPVLLFSAHFTAGVLTYLLIDPGLWERPHCDAVYSMLKDRGYYSALAGALTPCIAFCVLEIVISALIIIHMHKPRKLHSYRE